MVSGYATVNRQLPVQLGLHTDANALMMNQGGDVSDFYLGRLGTIVKPLSIPLSAPISRTPTIYTVSSGDDLNKIAAKYGVSVEEIRWSNPILSDTDKVTGGVKLYVPPVHGIVATVHSGDSVDSLAAYYHVSSQSIIDLNRIRLDPTALPQCMLLIIPDGRSPQLTIKVDAVPSLVRSYSPYLITLGAPIGPYVNPRFPWGWCTWYVSTRFNVTWLG